MRISYAEYTRRCQNCGEPSTYQAFDNVDGHHLAACSRACSLQIAYYLRRAEAA